MMEPDPATPSPASADVRQRYRWPLRIVLGAALIMVAWQAVGSFILPACDSSRVANVVGDRLGGEAIEDLTIREISSTSAGRACEATVVTANGTTRVEFLVAWDGWTPFVRVESVESR